MSQEKRSGYPSIDRAHLADVEHRVLHPKILPLSIFGAFMLINSKRLDELAIQDEKRTYSKRQVRDDTLVLAKALRVYSITRGKRLAIIAPNIYEGVVMTMAANAIGVQVVYFDPLETNKQLECEIDKYQPDMLFVCNWSVQRCRVIVEEVKTKPSVIVDFMAKEDSNVLLSCIESSVKDPQIVPFSSFKSAGEMDTKSIRPSVLANLLSKRVSLFLQTSGSTSGKPKGLPFTNESVFASMIYASNSTGTKTNDSGVSKVLCILPYRLPYGWMTIFVNLMGGNAVILAPGASPEDIGKYYLFKPSYIYGTPVILQAFIENTPRGVDLSFLEKFFSAGFSTPEKLYTKAMRWLAEEHHSTCGEICTNYGIGECLGVGTFTDGLPHCENTVGKFFYGPEFVIVDEEMREVHYGEPGELLVHSKTLCKGYFEDRELTKKHFVKYRGKTFFRTGDSVSLDQGGTVTFYGRKKRFYQPLGATNKVNCETIEEVILDCSLVKACAVVVVPDEEKMFTSKAFVVLRDLLYDEKKARDFIFRTIEAKLLDYQRPKYIEFLSSIPTMKSGKIDYLKLQNM